MNDSDTDGLRVGGCALLLLSDSLNVSILRQLAPGPLGSNEFAGQAAYVSRSTRFERLRSLEEQSLISRPKRPGRPPVSACHLTEAGRRLLAVADLLEVWLGRAPGGPLDLNDTTATDAIKAFAAGWGSTLLRWLAEAPHSLEQLDGFVDGLAYPQIERHVHHLISVGLAERAKETDGRHAFYTVTAWARESTTPLAGAVRWEQLDIPERAAAVTAVDAVGGLLLALPRAEMPAGLTGDCLLMVDTEPATAESLGAVSVRIEGGRGIASCVTAPELQLDARTWVRGTAAAWLDAVIEGHPDVLLMGGEDGLGGAIVTAIHEALFGKASPRF